MTQRLTIFLAGGEIVSANIDGIGLRIVAKADRDHVKIAILIDRCQATKALAL